jgi:hypothetical protein
MSSSLRRARACAVGPTETSAAASRRPAPRGLGWLLPLALRVGATVAATATGCAPALPSPDATLDAYAKAAERGDSEALYALLTPESRQALGKPGIERALKDGREELAQQGKTLQAGGWSMQAVAHVPYPDGEQATLILEGGAFRLASADALPAGARTPVDALASFRRVLARRSYSGLLRLLSRETRAAMERDLSAIVTGLERPDTLEVRAAGDTARVELDGGHSVRLRRENGIWRIEDFD